MNFCQHCYIFFPPYLFLQLLFMFSLFMYSFLPILLHSSQSWSPSLTLVYSVMKCFRVGFFLSKIFPLWIIRFSSSSFLCLHCSSHNSLFLNLSCLSRFGVMNTFFQSSTVFSFFSQTFTHHCSFLQLDKHKSILPFHFFTKSYYLNNINVHIDEACNAKYFLLINPLLPIFTIKFWDIMNNKMFIFLRSFSKISFTTSFTPVSSFTLDLET